MPIPKVEATRIAIDAAISYHATEPMAILVNIAIGEVKGIYEQATISGPSTEPLVMEIITIINAITKRNVIGITDVLISSSFEAVEPIAPYIKAYKRNPSTKNTIRYANREGGMLNIDAMIGFCRFSPLIL